MEAVFSWLAVNFDLPILDWIAQNLANPVMDVLMPAITALGNAGIFWIVLAVILLLIPQCRRTGLAMSAALLMGLVVCNLAMKPLFARIRPYDFQLEHFGREIVLLIPAEHDFSFPSGHAIASFEAATALTVYHKKWGISALVLASLIAFSRLYLYVHYPTDVLGSVILGIGLGILGTVLVNSLASRKIITTGRAGGML